MGGGGGDGEIHAILRMSKQVWAPSLRERELLFSE